MKELISRHQEKKRFWRKTTALAGILVALTACEQQAPITEGEIYQKDHRPAHTTTTSVLLPSGKILIPIPWSISHPEHWEVKIAQCPKDKEIPQGNIEEECKTNSFAVPQEVFNSLQIGQRADFKQPK